MFRTGGLDVMVRTMQIWGLTGNIACGKSAAESMLRELGLPVIDADQVARQVVEPGTEGLAEVVAAFGPGVLAGDRLDRAALGAIVFSDPEQRKQLEAITHPRIATAIAHQVMHFANEGHEVVIVSAALMVESGSYRDYAGMAVVTCPPEQQLKRLLARDPLSAEDAQRRIASQMPQDQKAAHAQVVLDNSGDLEHLRAQVQAFHDQHLHRP